MTAGIESKKIDTRFFCKEFIYFFVMMSDNRYNLSERETDMIKVLVLCDDVWHPGEVIERGLEDLQDCRFHFDFVRDAKDILTEDMLEKYPVIMNCKSNNLHAGNTYHETNCPEYAAFVGNHFVTHPPRCQVEVKVVGKHPITEGVTDFQSVMSTIRLPILHRMQKSFWNPFPKAAENWLLPMSARWGREESVC